MPGGGGEVNDDWKIEQRWHRQILKKQQERFVLSTVQTVNEPVSDVSCSFYNLSPRFGLFIHKTETTEDPNGPALQLFYLSVPYSAVRCHIVSSDGLINKICFILKPSWTMSVVEWPWYSGIRDRFSSQIFWLAGHKLTSPVVGCTHCTERNGSNKRYPSVLTL